MAIIAIGAISCYAMAQPRPTGSRVPGDMQNVAETRALLVSANDAMDKQQAALEAAVRDATARKKWSDQERSRFMQTVFRSKTHTDLDQQTKVLTTELRAMLQASQRGEIKGPQATELHLSKLRQLSGQLKVAFERQSTYVIDQLRNAH